jgi:Flp pilus assembly protein TadD
MQKFQGALQRAQHAGKDLSEIGKIMDGFQELLKEGKFKEAGERLDQALKLLGDENGQAAPPQDVPESLRGKIHELHEAIHSLIQKGDFAEAEKQIDRVLDLLKKR